MDNQISGVNYILASSIENKDNEITLKNEVPKSEYSMKNDDSREGTLRNEPPLSEKSLKKDAPLAKEPSDPRRAREVPREAPVKKEPAPVITKKEPEELKDPKEHKKVDEDGKIKWNTTHFVFGIEAGGSLIFYNH